MRLQFPDVRIMDARLRIGLIRMGEKLDVMARGNREADAAADARLLARRDMIDLEAVIGDALLEFVEIGVFEHLDRRARRSLGGHRGRRPLPPGRRCQRAF